MGHQHSLLPLQKALDTVGKENSLHWTPLPNVFCIKTVFRAFLPRPHSFSQIPSISHSILFPVLTAGGRPSARGGRGAGALRPVPPGPPQLQMCRGAGSGGRPGNRRARGALLRVPRLQVCRVAPRGAGRATFGSYSRLGSFLS